MLGLMFAFFDFLAVFTERAAQNEPKSPSRSVDLETSLKAVAIRNMLMLQSAIPTS